MTWTSVDIYRVSTVELPPLPAVDRSSVTTFFPTLGARLYEHFLRRVMPRKVFEVEFQFLGRKAHEAQAALERLASTQARALATDTGLRRLQRVDTGALLVEVPSAGLGWRWMVVIVFLCVLLGFVVSNHYFGGKASSFAEFITPRTAKLKWV